jgi:hypothetical protein
VLGTNVEQLCRLGNVTLSLRLDGMGEKKPNPANALTREICQHRSDEALAFARQADTQTARIMLEHIAGTWRRISERVPKGNQTET